MNKRQYWFAIREKKKDARTSIRSVRMGLKGIVSVLVETNINYDV
jgi:hypothetical protein